MEPLPPCIGSVTAVGEATKKVVAKVVDVEIGKIGQASLIPEETPVTGGYNSRRAALIGCILCCTCGCEALSGAARTALSLGLVVLLGVGTGLWVEGDNDDRKDLKLAGQIMICYVAVPLICIGALRAACGLRVNQRHQQTLVRV